MSNKNNNFYSLIFGQNYIYNEDEEFSNIEFNKNYYNKLIKKISNYKSIRHLIIRYIIDTRKEATRIIVRFFLKIINIMNLKKQILIHKIISERDRNSRILQSNLKNNMFRSLVKNILIKEKEYFTIFCNIKNSINISLDVFLKDGTKTNLKFEYCKIRKINVLYILRKIARGCNFRVNFLTDDKVVIDPMYRTDYDDQGNFFNIIDFEKIEEQELRRDEDNKRIIRYYVSQINRNKELKQIYLKRGIEREISSSEDGSSDEKKSLERSDNIKTRTLKDRCTLKRKTLSHIKIGTNQMSRSFNNFKNHQLKHNYTSSNLISSIKPILRSPNTSKTSLGHKRVSFSSTVQFSV